MTTQTLGMATAKMMIMRRRRPNCCYVPFSVHHRRDRFQCRRSGVDLNMNLEGWHSVGWWGLGGIESIRIEQTFGGISLPSINLAIHRSAMFAVWLGLSSGLILSGDANQCVPRLVSMS